MMIHCFQPPFTSHLTGSSFSTFHPHFMTSNAILGQRMVGCVVKYSLSEKLWEISSEESKESISASLPQACLRYSRQVINGPASGQRAETQSPFLPVYCSNNLSFHSFLINVRFPPRSGTSRRSTGTLCPGEFSR